MKVKATVSFAGAAVSMFPGEIRDIPEEAAAELIGCGYVEAVSAAAAAGTGSTDPESAGETAGTKAAKTKTKK